MGVLTVLCSNRFETYVTNKHTTSCTSNLIDVRWFCVVNVRGGLYDLEATRAPTRKTVTVRVAFTAVSPLPKRKYDIHLAICGNTKKLTHEVLSQLSVAQTIDDFTDAVLVEIVEFITFVHLRPLLVESGNATELFAEFKQKRVFQFLPRRYVLP